MQINIKVILLISFGTNFIGHVVRLILVLVDGEVVRIILIFCGKVVRIILALVLHVEVVRIILVLREVG